MKKKPRSCANSDDEVRRSLSCLCLHIVLTPVLSESYSHLTALTALPHPHVMCLLTHHSAHMTIPTLAPNYTPCPTLTFQSSPPAPLAHTCTCPPPLPMCITNELMYDIGGGKWALNDAVSDYTCCETFFVLGECTP